MTLCTCLAARTEEDGAALVRRKRIQVGPPSHTVVDAVGLSSRLFNRPSRPRSPSRVCAPASSCCCVLAAAAGVTTEVSTSFSIWRPPSDAAVEAARTARTTAATSPASSRAIRPASASTKPSSSSSASEQVKCRSTTQRGTSPRTCSCDECCIAAVGYCCLALLRNDRRIRSQRQTGREGAPHMKGPAHPAPSLVSHRAS